MFAYHNSWLHQNRTLWYKTRYWHLRPCKLIFYLKWKSPFHSLGKGPSGSLVFKCWIVILRKWMRAVVYGLHLNPDFTEASESFTISSNGALLHWKHSTKKKIWFLKISKVCINSLERSMAKGQLFSKPFSQYLLIHFFFVLFWRN